MLEKLFHFISALTQSIFTFLKILMRSRLRPHLPKATANSCIILGNGPSLNPLLKDHLEDLKQRELICVNKFPDTPYYTLIKPSYYIFISPQYWEKKKSDPNSDERNQIIEALVQNTAWNLKVLCPYRANENTDFIARLKQNVHLSIVFFNDTPVEGLEKLNRSFFNKGWGLPRPHNVIIPAVFMAIRLGYQNIYLFGADHSWLPMITVNDNNEALINRKHFYDESTAIAEKMYNLEHRPRRLHEILEKFVYTFSAYFQLEDFATSKGINIWNATPGSYIDAFSRITTRDALIDRPKNE